MATPSAIAKRTEKRQIEILEAVKMLEAEVAELKADIGRTDEVELKTEFDETIDRTDEILAAIRSTALDVGQQTRQVSIAIGSMADELVNIKAELKPDIAPSPAAATRRTKK
ncbi:hypothetical protein LCGC14_0874390 [marine sediment metagenome]|uniref:Uncharacterized protein n=1 Tax=marine sediment metagenome TaxID=412755 RepID=A0A0F9PPE1_9ZZZZ